MSRPDKQTGSGGVPSTPPGRRYGLFGVTTYPPKQGMSDRQRGNMALWTGVFSFVMTAVILILLFLSVRSPGLTVTFDSMGGSEAASQAVQYGELVSPPGEVLRPGYTLVGWSTDAGGESLWDFETDTVTDTLTLYAIWQPEADG